MVCVVISYHYLTSTTLKQRWEGAWGSATLNLVQWHKKPRCEAVRDGFLPNDRLAELALFILNNLPATAPPTAHTPGSPGTSSDHASASSSPGPSVSQVPSPGGWLPLARRAERAAVVVLRPPRPKAALLQTVRIA